MKTLPIAALTLAAAVTAACSTAPKASPELDAARVRIDQVAADPLARQAAATSLDAAEQDLHRAEQALREREPREVVDHYAYLARRNAEIAAEQVAERHSREAVDRGQAERDRVLLQARTREAERARDEAQRAQSQADAARSAALSASAEAEQLRGQLADLQAKPTDRGMVLTLGDVLFDTGKAQLKPGAMDTIDKLANFMREHESYQLLVEGHTDSVGSEDFNLQLSERRAEAVRNALVARGLDGSRVRARGLGEDFPVADNDNAGGRQQNRRVEVVFSDPQGNFPGAAERQARSRP